MRSGLKRKIDFIMIKIHLWKRLFMYQTEGDSGRIYIDALQVAGYRDFSHLKGLIK